MNDVETLSEVRREIETAGRRAGRALSEIRLIAAAKTVDAMHLKPYLTAGLVDVGENYVAEGIAKMDALRPEFPRVQWHLIGGLQSNKARPAVRFDWIHSLDRISLAHALNRAALEAGKVQNVLLQVNLGNETSKSGCAPHEVETLARACLDLPHLRVCGLMCLPPFHPDAERARPHFAQLRRLRDAFYADARLASCRELSMGMSNDFGVAVEEGATMVRVGTQLFGLRAAP